MHTLPTTPVVSNTSRTRFGMLYIGLLGVVGLGLGVATLYWSWGFCGYGVSGFLLFMCGLGLVRTLTAGGAWTADCPGCGARLTSDEHPFGERAHKVGHCATCGGWFSGTDLFQPGPTDYVHNEPIFEARASLPLQWPDGCARCGEPATRTVGITAVSDADAVASVVGVTTIGGTTVQVPACAKHGQTPVSIRTAPGGIAIDFYAYATHQAFVALNGKMALEDFLRSATHVDDALRGYEAPFRCHVHDQRLQTQLGWRSRMDATPGGSFIDDAMEHPYCLDVGEGLGEVPKSADPARVVSCPACVAGMKARGWFQ